MHTAQIYRQKYENVFITKVNFIIYSKTENVFDTKYILKVQMVLLIYTRQFVLSEKKAERVMLTFDLYK